MQQMGESNQNTIRVFTDKGGVHIMGEICPRSDPDIAHMKYSNILTLLLHY